MNTLACLCERCSELGACPCVRGSMFLGAVLTLGIVLCLILLGSLGADK